MSQVNRPPTGLQQLLGSQNFGDNPDQLLNEVRPTLDLLPMYGSGLLRKKTGTGARTNTGEVCNIEFFGDAAIVAIGATAYNGVPTTNEQIEWSLGLKDISGDNPTEIITLKEFSHPSVPYTQTTEVTGGMVMPYPFVIQSGVKVTLKMDYYSGASISWRLSVLFYDLQPGGSF